MAGESELAVRTKGWSALKTVTTAWLTAGTVDITVASFYFPLAGKYPLIRMYQGIASGVLGAKAFSGGVPAAALGLALHYMIALIWTTFYFLVYPKVSVIGTMRVTSAAAYGVFVSCIMTFVVLPLSNVHHYPVEIAPFLVSTIILMFTIGLPVTTIVRNYYSAARLQGS